MGHGKNFVFARKIASRQPIWVCGGSRVMLSVISGEIPMMMGNNYDSVLEERYFPNDMLQKYGRS
jgi:hypothetical protein